MTDDQRLQSALQEPQTPEQRIAYLEAWQRRDRALIEQLTRQLELANARLDELRRLHAPPQPFISRRDFTPEIERAMQNHRGELQRFGPGRIGDAPSTMSGVAEQRDNLDARNDPPGC